MKLFLSTSVLAAASAQIAPARLRSQNLALIPQEHAAADAADLEWGDVEEFGRFDLIPGLRMLLPGTSMSMPTSMPTSMSMSMPTSMSMSMPTSMPTSMSMSMSISMSMSMSMGVPTPTPFIAAPDTPTFQPSYNPTPETLTPTTDTQAPSPSVNTTQAPTMSKSGKSSQQELFAYSWTIPPEYTGYFEIYKGHGHGPKAMHTDLELIDVVELGNGTSGSNSVFLPREEYTIVVVNQNQTVGFCCDGTQPGWINFMWGGLEFNKITGTYKQKKDKDKFVAEFHKNPGKVDLGEDGAYFKFEARL